MQLFSLCRAVDSDGMLINKLKKACFRLFLMTVNHELYINKFNI